MPAFEVAAGILLLLQSIELIFARPGGLSTLTVSEEEEAELSDEIAVFPLAIPLIAGPASITAAMLLMGQAGADLLKIAVFFLMLLFALAITYGTLMLVEPLGRILGVTGTNVIARISGILLAALAVQFIFNGIGATCRYAAGLSLRRGFGTRKSARAAAIIAIPMIKKQSE
jgi:multiple antibiotic resistance protein